MEAASRARPSNLSLLISHGCNVNERNERHRTAFHYCLMNVLGSLDSDDILQCMDILYANKADINAIDTNGASPLHVAISNENVEAILWLLKHNCQLKQQTRAETLPGVLSSVITNKRITLTPLMLAIHLSNRRIVELLINCGAECRNLGWLLVYCQGFKLLWEFLKECTSKPMPLQILCRTVIRRTVGQRIMELFENFDCLPLPSSVKRYILIEEELRQA